jgi:hypothetical protein
MLTDVARLQDATQSLVGGMEHLDYFCPFSWECHHPN